MLTPPSCSFLSQLVDVELLTSLRTNLKKEKDNVHNLKNGVQEWRRYHDLKVSGE